MYDASYTPPHQDDAEIASHQVSDDGVTWRPYDPARDDGRTLLHHRIEFAAPTS